MWLRAKYICVRLWNVNLHWDCPAEISSCRVQTSPIRDRTVLHGRTENDLLFAELSKSPWRAPEAVVSITTCFFFFLVFYISFFKKMYNCFPTENKQTNEPIPCVLTRSNFMKNYFCIHINFILYFSCYKIPTNADATGFQWTCHAWSISWFGNIFFFLTLITNFISNMKKKL